LDIRRDWRERKDADFIASSSDGKTDRPASRYVLPDLSNEGSMIWRIWEGTDISRTSSSLPQQKRSREYHPSRTTFQGMRKGNTRRIHGMHSIG